MKNLTISLDEETHQLSRRQAAAKGMSMSRFVADLVREHARNVPIHDEAAERQRRLEALQRVFDAPKIAISKDGRMPTADERNARR